MGRFLGGVLAVLALALVWVPGAAAEGTLAEQAAAIPTPSCAEGPTREGDLIVGTECADRIVVPPTVAYVDGGPGNDTIVGSLTTAASGSCETGCHLEVGSQTFEGGEGNDIVYGDRGNDILRGNLGNDRLYGGIGDDRLEGGPGNDWLSGGFGADTIDGGEGNDYVRGDATIDHIFDTGGGYDTLSFATGVTPGFTGASPAEVSGGFPGVGGERGIRLEIGEPAPGETGIHALDGEPSDAGGNDEVERGVFERIIGTPFSDYIVGTGASEEILGGGGADVIEGGGGADTLRGGADGDFLEVKANSQSTTDGGPGVDGCVGETTQIECEGTTKAVHPRATNVVSVGKTAAGSVAAGSGSVDIYLVGSTNGDGITATYGAGAVAFSLAGTGVSFDTSATDAGGCTLGSQTPPTTATCPLFAPTLPAPPLDAIVLAGMGGADSITANGFPDGTSVIELGGEGGDTLNGGPSEDVLADGDGTGVDTLHAGAGDDALLHNGGADLLDGGEGSDLFLSVSVCDGETIEGGTSVGSDRDNASWARLGSVAGSGVAADLLTGEAGRAGSAETPACTSAGVDHLTGIEDLEGSEGNDVLIGNEGVNQLLGHKGSDVYRALGGNDTIFANSGTVDRVIDCGEGEDSATIDLASVGDPAPIGCEHVREGAAEEFRTEIEEPVPTTTVPPVITTPPMPPPKPKPDRTPPRTKVLRRPPAVVRVARRHRATVFFRFAANEKARFECKLDAKPYRRCHSPLRTHLAIGRHTLHVFAIDAGGNRDKTPALFRVRVVARHR
jgi:Ca2+-binding RTX toxin-like protein